MNLVHLRPGPNRIFNIILADSHRLSSATRVLVNVSDLPINVKISLRMFVKISSRLLCNICKINYIPCFIKKIPLISSLKLHRLTRAEIPRACSFKLSLYDIMINGSTSLINSTFYSSSSESFSPAFWFG